MIHLYHGNGKGKTTAAVGLAVRAAGSGMKVLFTQFFKDGSSSEIDVLRSIPGIDVLIPEVWYGRYKRMTAEQQEEIRHCYTALMHDIEKSAERYDLIVLDEAVSAYNYGMLERDSFVETLMSSEYGERIALQWAVKGVRNKRTLLKAYVIGLLKDEGVLKGSYDAIAEIVGLTDKPRTFSRAMSEGKKQPYALWVKEWVNR